MQNILRKRILREFKNNAFRYLALAFLILLGMYLVISLVGAADTIMIGVDNNARVNNLEDGEFSVFVPLAEKQKQEIKEKGVSLEEIFSTDFSLEDNSVIRVFQNRKEINRIQTEEGRLPEQENEVLLEKRYCEEHRLSIGENIEIGKVSMQIVGIGTVPDYDGMFRQFSESNANSSNFGLAFVTVEQYEALKDKDGRVNSEEYTYAYRLNDCMTDKELKEEIKSFPFSAKDVKDSYFQEYWSETVGENYDKKKVIQKRMDGGGNLDEALDGKISNLTRFVTAGYNPRIKASAKDQIITRNAGLIVGVIAMVLFTYVISVFVIHGIERESSIIGTLYALGIKKRNLMFHYLTLPVIITFLAGVAGTLLGFSRYGITVQMAQCYSYFSIPEFTPEYLVYLILYGTLMPPLSAVFINCIVINKKLSSAALSLIRNEQKISRGKNLNLGNLSFVSRFCIRQMLREARSAFTVVFGMFISFLLLIMGLNCYIMCKNISVKNIEDARYEYMYTYKYPDAQVKKGGEACYGKSLSKPVYGNEMEVMLLGIDKENAYFDAVTEKGKNKIVLSSAAAQKYRMKIGNQIVLSDLEEDIDYAFTVSGITQYSVGLYAFMDIEDMRELFGQEEDYYNVVFSDHALSIASGRLYAVTSKADVQKSADVFIRMTASLVSMLCTVSVLVFCIVMYLMMKVMVDRSASGISLFRIFGYRTREIKKLYLDGNFYIIALGAMVGLPLAKKIVDNIYPMMLSNVACGMDLIFSWQMYAGIYAAVILLYIIISRLLALHIKKITPAEVLKNRE